MKGTAQLGMYPPIVSFPLPVVAVAVVARAVRAVRAVTAAAVRAVAKRLGVQNEGAVNQSLSLG